VVASPDHTSCQSTSSNVPGKPPTSRASSPSIEPAAGKTRRAVQGPVAAALRDVLARRGAVFFGALAREVGGFPGTLLDVLWQLVWSGEATNDTLEPFAQPCARVICRVAQAGPSAATSLAA